MFMQLPMGDAAPSSAKDQVQAHCRRAFEHLIQMRENLDALNMGLLDPEERIKAETMRDGIANLITHIADLSSKLKVD